MGKQILSCRFIRAQEGFLLAIQGYLDSGARDAAVKRRVLVREEERGVVNHFTYLTRWQSGFTQHWKKSDGGDF